MKTRFQYSRKRSFSPPGRSSGVPQSRPRSMYSSLHGPHGPLSPACQKFSERGHRTMRSRGTPTDSHASIASSSGPRPSSSSPSKTVIQMSSGSKPKPSCESSHAHLDGRLLEVVADREVAEHLEERQVPGGVADVLDVGRAKALLHRRQARVGRLLLAAEVRHERVHARRRQQDRGVRRRRHERRRGQPQVVARARSRRGTSRGSRRSSCPWRQAIVAHPTIASPRRKTAVCPGAAPSNGSSRWI